MTFSSFFQKTGFDISCQLSLFKTICMKCTECSIDDILKYFSYVILKTGVGFSYTLSPQHFPCKLSSVEICVKCQTCFTGENKKRGHEFAICWVSPESDKGLTGQWIVDIIHSVGDMCRPRSDCAEMPVHLGISCSQIPKGRFLFLFKWANIYSTSADQTRSACAAGSRSKIFNTSLNYVDPVNCHYCFE